MLSAKRLSLKLSIIAATVIGLAALPSVASAQHENDHPTGYPLDWSNSHVKYGRPGNLEEQKARVRSSLFAPQRYAEARVGEGR